MMKISGLTASRTAIFLVSPQGRQSFFIRDLLELDLDPARLHAMARTSVIG